MQYILTQEELDALHKTAREGEKLKKLYPNKEVLQAFCSMVADHMPVQDGWYKGKVWGCILTTREKGWYCDSCPAKKLCPHDYKHWSK